MNPDILQLLSASSNVAVSLTFILTIITVWTAVNKLSYQNKLTKGNSHIELRKLFSEPNRFNVHANLRPGGAWSVNPAGPHTNIDWLYVEDYLGLFEICEKLLQDNILDQDLFKKSYRYRLENIARNDAIWEKINQPGEDWTLFFALLTRYNVHH